MRKIVAAFLSVVCSSLVAFFVHKPIADRLPLWVGEQMGGVEIKRPPYGLEVVIPAALSSLEVGAGLFFAYFVIRRSFPNWSTFARAICLFLLCLALGGHLFRFPLMQLVVGNPLGVTLVQHAGIWLPLFAASLTLAFSYEWLSKRVA